MFVDMVVLHTFSFINRHLPCNGLLIPCLIVLVWKRHNSIADAVLYSLWNGLCLTICPFSKISMKKKNWKSQNCSLDNLLRKLMSKLGTLGQGLPRTPKCPPRQQASQGQHGAHLGPVGPRWAPCWPHEPCYQGCVCHWRCDFVVDKLEHYLFTLSFFF